MVVRAKFRLTGVKRYIGDMWDYDQKKSVEQHVADLDFVVVTPDYDAKHPNGEPVDENAMYWKSTPTGSIHLGTVNDAAIQELLEHLGGEFYVDFRWVEGTPKEKVRKIEETRV